MEEGITKEYPLIWPQAVTYTGCYLSIQNSVSPSIRSPLLDEIAPGKRSGALALVEDLALR